MPSRDAPAEALILDALSEEVSRRALSRVLLIGIHACSTVHAVNQLAESEKVVLLHLDRATGAVGCGVGNRELFLGDEPGPGGQGPYAVVAVNVEAAKSYRLLREILGQTAGYLDAGGVVLVAGPRKGGAEVAARALQETFESVALVTYRKGYRIYRAAGPRAPAHDDGVDPPWERGHPGRFVRGGPPGNDCRAPSLPAVAQEIETVTLRGRELQLLLDDRIFARGRLDPATRMLAEVFEVPPGAVVLDLGAGNGILGILAALLEPSAQVTLVDSDPLAIQASRKNAALNRAPNVSAHLSDALHDIPDQKFDLVLMNPPFHRGRVHDTSIADRFVAESAQALRPGGAIYVVCNRFLRYEPMLERLVGPVREVAGDRQFKVLLARRPYFQPHSRERDEGTSHTISRRRRER